MSTTRFLVTRILGAVLVLLVIAAITYALFTLLPTNPARAICDKPCTPDRLAQVKAFLGTDKPWVVQFLTYLGGIFAGRSFGTGSTALHCAAPCFGYSFQLHESVTSLIIERLSVTASIAVGAAVLWLVVGVAGGALSALRRGSAVDRGVMGVAVAGVSAPTYLVGLLLILFFGFTLRVLPTSGYVPFSDDPVGWFSHLVLPWVTLAFVSAAIYARLTRGEMLEAMSQDFIRTARARGLFERQVVVRHGLRTAILPVVTLFGLDLGSLLGGAIITEKVFSMQGIGSLLISAVSSLDLQVVVGVTLFAAFMIVVANVIVDIVYGVVDPRVRRRA
ncbi:ABC transporter permease [Frondihabitans australicus]|uniref:Peptide/nickel transport system permease protein n=1 Tax=Frondihabitans australicus TaxID=386892 RepID=A0A495IKG5_9MICO|nr:ABC transporter permease [Frondihabitans australicus]RKR76457.1 peptide/nickel transport system permease protein [Frondihabitans australicus]